MPTRPVTSTGKADIAVDRSLVLVRRHPHCDARLASSPVSRGHCCLQRLGNSESCRNHRDSHRFHGLCCKFLLQVGRAYGSAALLNQQHIYRLWR
jgi:hypothetical protein